MGNLPSAGRGEMGAAESRVAEYVRQHASEIIGLQLSDISRACEVSDATVVRFCRRMGYRGLKEYKIALAQEQSQAEAPAAQAIEWQDDLLLVKQKVFGGCLKSLQDSCQNLDDRAVTRAVEALGEAANIDIYALGGSVAVASYFHHQLMKLGVRSSVYADGQTLRLSMPQLGEKDVALAISCSGETPEVVKALSWATKQKATTICITNAEHSSLARQAAIRLFTSGGRFLGEDYNTFSRLAQLAVVDTLYACLAVKKGPRHMEEITSRNRQARNM